MKIFFKSFWDFKIIGEQVVIFDKRYILKIVWFIREETFFCFPKLFIIYYVFYIQIEIVCLFGFPKQTNAFISLFIVCFFVTFGSTFKDFFLSFDLTITLRWISLFMRGTWFAPTNLLCSKEQLCLQLTGKFLWNVLSLYRFVLSHTLMNVSQSLYWYILDIPWNWFYGDYSYRLLATFAP